MTDKIAIERKILEHTVIALEYAYSADDEMVQESIKYLRAALAQKAEPDEQEVALQEIAEFGQDQLREPRTQEEKEQYAFEDWLASECPSGDVESVQRQWEESAEYLDLQDDTPAQPAKPVQRLSDDDIDRTLATTLDALVKLYGIDHAMHVRTDIAKHHTLRRAFARAIEAAIVPPGYALVPIEPTREMLHAAHDVLGVPLARLRYHAMIAAAQKASHDPR